MRLTGWMWPMVAAAAVLMCGCATGPAEPRMRLGSIPFPGPFTLYAVADPRHLGCHRYESWFEKHDGPDEVYRGIMYTRRAGFVDLSHIRESIDIAKYVHDRAVERLGTGSDSTFHLEWADTRYEVTVKTPGWWSELAETDRARLAREAAIRVGQRLTVIIGAWHELGTWYGQETVPPFSEKNSAFTWDDPTSHVVAAIVAGRALRDEGPSFNAAVTRELEQELATLEVVDCSCESEAVQAVRGRWWKDGVAIRRDLDTGLGTNIKTPWLVSGAACIGDDAAPMGLIVPELGVEEGRDLRELFDMRIRPPRWLMRRALGCTQCPDVLVSERELLEAIERLRIEVKQEFGPEADQP